MTRLSRTALFAVLVIGPIGASWDAHAARSEALARADGDEPERKWIKHRVVPGERLSDIEARYGVTRKELIRWNRSLKKKQWIYAGRKIKVYARKFPPPREKTTYIVQFGDTWAKIAGRYNITTKDLRRWNKKVPRAFRAGTKLVVYTNPVAQPVGDASTNGHGPSLPNFQVRPGGLAVGRPNRGRLINGVKLPKSDEYKLGKPDTSWGTSHSILQIQRAVAQFRRKSGYEGELVIGALSKKNGGRFRPHKSHQTGRDVDIRLPKVKGVPRRKTPTADEIDWRAAWGLIEAFIATGEIEYIFLDYRRQKRLYSAAKDLGVPTEKLKKYFQYPRGSRTNNGLVRHAKGHIVHVHIRIKCTPGNGRCGGY